MSNDDNCEDARELLSISSSNYQDDDESYDSSSDTDSFSLVSTSDDSQASQDLSTQSNRVAAGDLLPHSYSSDDLNSDLEDDDEEDGISDEATTITLTNMPTDNGNNKINSTSKEEGEGQDDSSSILEMQIFDVLHLTEKEQELDDSAGTYNNLICITTFNVMNGYTAKAAVQIATSLRLNYIAFQETGSSINESTKSFIELGTSYTQKVCLWTNLHWLPSCSHGSRNTHLCTTEKRGKNLMWQLGTDPMLQFKWCQQQSPDNY